MREPAEVTVVIRPAGHTAVVDRVRRTRDSLTAEIVVRRPGGTVPGGRIGHLEQVVRRALALGGVGRR